MWFITIRIDREFVYSFFFLVLYFIFLIALVYTLLKTIFTLLSKILANGPDKKLYGVSQINN